MNMYSSFKLLRLSERQNCFAGKAELGNRLCIGALSEQASGCRWSCQPGVSAGARCAGYSSAATPQSL